MRAAVSLIFFLSGVSALIFETLWFRQAGIALGTSVWSAALTLGGFMAGIALGNFLVARYGARIGRPILIYVVLEVLIGLTGLALVLIFPLLPAFLAQVLRELTDTQWLLNLARLTAAFLLLVVPTTAMGATLAVLVKAMSRHNRNFGAVLGSLYGWNTLGAVCGALLGEALLIERFGVLGTGLSAALLNIVAALIAFAISCASEAQAPAQREAARPLQLGALPGRAKRLLAVAFLSGLIMLALEVVWFRFLLLAHDGTSLIFAVMLAVVLAGISSGGLAAGLLCRHQPLAHSYLRHVTLLSAVLLVVSYYGFDVFSLQQTQRNTATAEFVLFAAYLMLPVSFLSGVAFTLTGRAMKDEMELPVRTAGAVTLFNTLGAMLGSFCGGFLLLPFLGMELSFFVLAAAYGATALLVPPTSTQHDPNRRYTLAAFAACAACLVLFPFGMMAESYFKVQAAKYPAHDLIEVRESRTGTLFYYRVERFGQPHFYRLATNGFSMSATSVQGRRYMKLYVYLPLALKPDIADTLLISYGVGSTAKALTDSPTIRSIDVVDISRDIVDMSAIVYPHVDDRPLSDARATLHVEDGRFFLNTTRKRYDLITSEPPPPKISGVVNLYSQEYFELIYQRLAEGGYATYWLPNRELNDADSLAIIKAFCNAFSDCSLWSGLGLDWMLMGTRNGQPLHSMAGFAQQWQQPVVARELEALGFEHPAQLGALFMADGAALAELTHGVPPVTDNFPLRISSELNYGTPRSALFASIMDEEQRLERFRNSAYIAWLLPEQLRHQIEPYFSFERPLRNHFIPKYQDRDFYRWEALDRVLTESDLQTLPLWLLGSDRASQEIASELNSADAPVDVELELAIGALARRDYPDALARMNTYFDRKGWQFTLYEYNLYLYAVARNGQFRLLRALIDNTKGQFAQSESVQTFIAWLNTRFELAHAAPSANAAVASN